MLRRIDWLGRAVCAATCLIAAIAPVSHIQAAPSVYGVTPTVYATTTDPSGLQFGPDGELFVGHNVNAHVHFYRVPPGGGAVQEWGQTVADPDDFDIHDGYLYVGDHFHVHRYDLANAESEVWADLYDSGDRARNLTSVLVDTQGIFGPAGCVIISSANTSPHFEVIDPWTKTPSALLDTPHGRSLTIVGDTLYWARDGVQQLTSAGVHTQVEDGGYSWDGANGLVYSPAEDSFYVCESVGRIVRLPRSGDTPVLVGDGFDSVSALTLGPDGALYVSDQVNDVVWRAVPEPACLSLLTLGGVALIRRRRAA